MNVKPTTQAGRSQRNDNARHATGFPPEHQLRHGLVVVEEELHSFSDDNWTGQQERLLVKVVGRWARIAVVPDDTTEVSP